jgi:hypothetical protein
VNLKDLSLKTNSRLENKGRQGNSMFCLTPSGMQIWSRKGRLQERENYLPAFLDQFHLEQLVPNGNIKTSHPAWTSGESVTSWTFWNQTARPGTLPDKVGIITDSKHILLAKSPVLQLFLLCTRRCSTCLLYSDSVAAP